MSGPKSYSVKVFDKELVHIFQLQCEVEDILSNLKSYQDAKSEPDPQLKAFLLDIRKECSIALKPFSLGTTAHTIAGVTKAGYDKQIQIKKNQLTRLIAKIKEKEVSLSKNDIINSNYQSYEAAFTAFSKSLEQLKKEIQVYLQKVIKENKNIDFDDYSLQLDNIQFSISKELFSPLFDKQKAVEKLIASEIDSKKHIAKIKAGIQQKIQQSQTTPTPPHKKETPILEEGELEKITTLINHKIALIHSKEKQVSFYKELEDIQGVIEQKKGLFLLQQLLRQINQYSSSQVLKEELESLYIHVLNASPHPTLIKEHEVISRNMAQILKDSEMKDRSIEHILEKGKTFLTVNQQRIQKDRMRQKERAFIKQQLVMALEQRKYKVVDDTQVIDFEQQSEFLLKVPDKDNYIGVELKKNDTLSYIFYSNNNNEEITGMSTEKRVRKVKEMESSCDDFYEIMQQLDQLGITNKIRKPRKAKESYLQALPEKYQNRIEKTSHYPPSNEEKEDDKKKYLDD